MKMKIFVTFKKKKKFVFVCVIIMKHEIDVQIRFNVLWDYVSVSKLHNLLLYQ